MYVCMYVCMYVLMYVCMYTYTHLLGLGHIRNLLGWPRLGWLKIEASRD